MTDAPAFRRRRLVGVMSATLLAAVSLAAPSAAAEGDPAPESAPMVSPDRATLAGWGRNDKLLLGIEDVYDPQQFGTVYDEPTALYDGVDSALNGVGVRRVSVGSNFGCAVTTEAAVVCWGNNSQYQYGSGGPASGPAYPAVPVKADGELAGKSVVDVRVGSDTGCALTSDGEVFCWGTHNSSNGAKGRAGTGETDSFVAHAEPRQIDMSGDLVGETITQLSYGLVGGCVLTATGKVACWGWNVDGSLGRDDFVDPEAFSPVLVDDSSWSGETVTQIATADIGGCALTDADAVYCWGRNTSPASGVPVAVDMTPLAGFGEVRSLTVGSRVACASTDLGAVFCWGTGSKGQLGNGDIADSVVPVQVDGTAFGSEKVIEVSAMAQAVCARTDAFKVYCWGLNNDPFGAGRLGNGSADAQSAVPVAVSTTTALAGRYVTRLAAAPSASGMLVISQATEPLDPVDVEVELASASIVYGDGTPAISVSVVDPLSGDEVAGAVVVGDCTVYEAGTDTVVSDDPLLPGAYEIACEVTANEGFEIASNARVPLTVAKADLDCVVSDYSGVFDGLVHQASVTCTGVGSDTFTVAATPGHSAVGSYTDSWSIAESDRYAEASGTAMVTITPATTTPVTTTPATITPVTTTPATTTPATTTPVGDSGSGSNPQSGQLPPTGSSTGPITLAVMVLGLGFGLSLLGRRRLV